MPDAVHLNISNESDELSESPSKISFCKLKYFGFVFLTGIPILLIAIELFLYPFPPQINAFKFCENIPDLISRSEFKNLKVDFDEADKGRVRMATHNYYVLTFIDDEDTANGYNDLNLNQNSKFSTDAIFETSKSVKIENFFECNKSAKDFPQTFVKNGNKIMNIENPSNYNKSTLSLHISAYENSVEGIFPVKTKENGLLKKSDNIKNYIFDPLNPFEFPRQQEDNQVTDTKVMEFKASQKLLCPNKKDEVDIQTVLKLLVDKYGLPDHNVLPNREEQKVVNRLSGILEQLETEESLDDLDFEREGFDLEYNFEILSEVDSDDDPEYEPPQAEKRYKLEDEYTKEEWDDIIEMRDKGYSFTTIQHRYRKLRNLRDINRVRKLREKGGSFYSKFHHLDEMVVNEFVLWKSLRMIVHDIDIADCAFKLATELGIPNFKASRSWVLRFKKKHRIVSRKITTYLTKAQIEEQKDLKSIIHEFRQKAKLAITKRPLLRVFNSDQTGLKKEMVSGRSLDYQGTKKVEVCIQRSDDYTHSYTIQPLIGADGTLHLPVFVCFLERKPPQCFERELKPFTNIKAVHSTSGKMTSQLAIKWLKESFVPTAGAMPLLIVDSWSGYVQAMEEKEAKHIEFLIIPPKTTGMLQPLDLFFNRQLKAFIKDLSDKIRRLYGNDVILSSRTGIGKLLHLTFAQFSAPCFKPLIKYAWFCCGYIDERPEKFETPVQKCFHGLTLNSTCEFQHVVDERAFIRCAKCHKFLCFKHFFEEMHDC